MLPTDTVDTSIRAILMDLLVCAVISFVLIWAFFP